MPATPLARQKFTLRTSAFVFIVTLITTVCAHADQSIQLRSGNGTVGGQDAQLRFVRYAVGQDTPPTDADFTAAQSGTFAYIDTPYPTYLKPANFSDPLAQWVGTTQNLGGGSALYAIPFTVTDTVIAAATLSLGYSVDNAVHGVYINGTEISNFVNDGDYHGEYYYMRSDIASLLKPNTTNWLYIKTYDYAGYAGLMFTAALTTQGTTPGAPTITPNQGGNAGSVSFRIIASGFEAGTSTGATPAEAGPTVTLTGTGTIVTATSVSVANPNVLTGTFDLTSAASGVATVTVTNRDGTSTVLSNAFTILAGGAADVAIQKIGTPAVDGYPQTFYITQTNHGSVDSGAAPVLEFVLPWHTFQSATPAPTQTQAVSSNGYSYDGFLEWDFPGIPSGQSSTVPYTVLLDKSVPAGTTVTGPVCQDSLGSDCQKSAQTCVGLSLPVCIGSILEPIFSPVCLLTWYQCWTGYTECKNSADSAQRNCSAANSPVLADKDPNDLTGPSGYGTPKWIQEPPQISYALSFNNLATATKAVTNVAVTNKFDPQTVDLTTLTVNAVTIGGASYTIPGIPLIAQPFTQDIDLRPAQNLIVRVTGSLDQTTDQAGISFDSIDPNTGLAPTDPTIGFIAPNTGGVVLFSAHTKPDLATGTAIQSSGSVIFDTNAAINTNTWTNTIDVTAPASKMAALSSTVPLLTFPVSWSGTDQGSGIANYSIYVSDNGGPFTDWLPNSMGTSSTYPGVAGHTYAFYSIAIDNVGNVEAAKTVAETTTQVVLPAPSLSLQASSPMAFPGQSITLTATVAVPAGLTIVPTGKITFLSGTATLGSGALNASGVATLTTVLPNGNDAITAQYGGDTNYVASTSNVVSVSVGMLATSTSVTASANPANLGASITLTATVTPASGSGVPTGTITFNDGSTALGTVSLNGSGMASYSSTSLTAGVHSITAVYSGDPDYTGSTSTALSLTVNAPGFALAIAPSSLTIAVGGSGTATVTLTPVGGFNTQVAFSCTGLPAYSTCSFAPASVTPTGSNSAVTSIATIATNVQSTSAARLKDSFDKRNPTLLALAFFGLPAAIIARRRFGRKICLLAPGLLFVALLSLAAVSMPGCGGSSTPSGPTTPKGTSTVTVTATGGVSTQTAALTLTVN